MSMHCRRSLTSALEVLGQCGREQVLLQNLWLLWLLAARHQSWFEQMTMPGNTTVSFLLLLGGIITGSVQLQTPEKNGRHAALWAGLGQLPVVAAHCAFHTGVCDWGHEGLLTPLGASRARLWAQPLILSHGHLRYNRIFNLRNQMP